jgi:hypothetical protein
MSDCKFDTRKEVVEATARDISAWARVIRMRRIAEGNDPPKPLYIIRRRRNRPVLVVRVQHG